MGFLSFLQARPARGQSRFSWFRSSKNKQWYFRYSEGNGEPMFQSEGYKTRRAMLDAIWTIKAGAQRAAIVEVDAPA